MKLTRKQASVAFVTVWLMFFFGFSLGVSFTKNDIEECILITGIIQETAKSDAAALSCINDSIF